MNLVYSICSNHNKIGEQLITFIKEKNSSKFSSRMITQNSSVCSTVIMNSENYLPQKIIYIKQDNTKFELDINGKKITNNLNSDTLWFCGNVFDNNQVVFMLPFLLESCTKELSNKYICNIFSITNSIAIIKLSLNKVENIPDIQKFEAFLPIRYSANYDKDLFLDYYNDRLKSIELIRN